MTVVHVVVPEGIDDPGRPSGGNRYDRRVMLELVRLGWSVHEHAVPGSWPTPAPADLAALDKVVSGLPERALVLLDGLVASTAPEVLVPQAHRLRLVVLVHMPLADGPPAETGPEAARRERAVLLAAGAVVVTSAWTRHLLLDRHGLRPDRVHVAEPGVDPTELAPGTPTGAELLCVAAVVPHKGYDVLLSALAAIKDLPWRCTCVGSRDRDGGYADRLHRQAAEAGIDHRVRFSGPLTGADLDAAYAAADVLVLPSRGETYGMVAAEALARGLPVVATTVGGLPDTLGRDHDGNPPGLLVPPDDPAALADALSAWLRDAGLRQRLRLRAGRRRSSLPGWSATAAEMARALAAAA